ncbi:MAG TPA: nuclear transport factor 2 family protein [Solirubrobacteraceae bacterium]|nr:nuclear transport factor 2 family protein [Solirubrobacteraceae bacterium]
MSENLDLVRSIYADWERGDFSRADWFDPEIEFVRADGPAPGSWRGLKGMAEGYRDFLSNWDDYRMQGDEFREVDDERVFVLVHATGRGKASGVELGETWSKSAAVFRVKAGRVTMIIHYFDRDRALADLGLER